ncbi:hypothetical protein KI387_026026, partial [Taxus chinensis]
SWDRSTRGTRGTRKRGSPEGKVFRSGEPGQKYARDAWDAKVRIARRKSFSSVRDGTEVREERVGRESAVCPKLEFFIQESRDRSTRGTHGMRKRGSPEGIVFRLGQLGQKYARDAKARIARRKSFSAGTARTKVHEGRVGRESADRPKELFFVWDSREKSTRGTQKHGSPEGS